MLQVVVGRASIAAREHRWEPAGFVRDINDADGKKGDAERDECDDEDPRNGARPTATRRRDRAVSLGCTRSRRHDVDAFRSGL